MAASKGTPVSVGGRDLTLTNLDKVLYPATDSSTGHPGPAFTKAEVIDYYARIAPFVLPHLAGRCITFLRFPDGEGGDVIGVPTPVGPEITKMTDTGLTYRYRDGKSRTRNFAELIKREQIPTFPG